MQQSPNPLNPILVVDDEHSILLSIDTTLRVAGMNNITTCQDSRKVMDLLSENPVEIVLLDLNMPHVRGEKLLDVISRDFSEIPVIVVTGAMDVDTAVSCMKSGAFDYVVKPVEEDRLMASIHRALSFRELKRENFALKQHILSETLEQPEAFNGIITNNKKMLSIFQYIESIAQTSQPVLVRGETGVGKELVARTLHTLSGLKGRYTTVNVAGLDDNVFSDTLFGHVRGAFTGADVERPGLIEQASGGTLFLDEIGDLSMASQVKLLRLLQEGEYHQLGQDEPKRTDARIVASTNRDLWSLQKSGQFRKDLNFRLRTHRIYIPPLRERTDDIPLLTEHFLAEASRALKKKAPTPARELFTLLKSYHFPGNVRELKAMIFDAVSRHKSGVLSLNVFRSHIQAHRTRERDEPLTPPSPESGERPLLTFSEKLPTLKQAASLLVAEALRRTDGNQSVAAGILGISQQALSKRLKK
ncbi:MAG: sigma-54-dependent Fis family transcriptional regulator [Desulfobacterales bacterium]|nr:sigma-54-dependent Fis family transcriptional regulator [Desulfobacterales bacterium]